jgi:hypothetical protein
MITAFQPDAFQNDAFQIAAVVPPVEPVRMRATSERYHMRRDKFNQYFPEDIDIEDALLLWYWKLINE